MPLPPAMPRVDAPLPSATTAGTLSTARYRREDAPWSLAFAAETCPQPRATILLRGCVPTVSPPHSLNETVKHRKRQVERGV